MDFPETNNRPHALVGSILNQCGKDCTRSRADTISRNILNGSSDSSQRFQITYKRRSLSDHLLVPRVPKIAPLPPYQSIQGSSNWPWTSSGSAIFPVSTLPNTEGCIPDPSVILSGTATGGIAGPPIGVVDIGISKAAYFFRVALPGVRRDYSQFSCEIESNGKVHICGTTSGGKTIRKRSRVFHIRFQQLCPPGPFTVSFSLPGPVDPRLFTPNFRSDGIFEGIVIKYG